MPLKALLVGFSMWRDLLKSPKGESLFVIASAYEIYQRFFVSRFALSCHRASPRNRRGGPPGQCWIPPHSEAVPVGELCQVS